MSALDLPHFDKPYDLAIACGLMTDQVLLPSETIEVLKKLIPNMRNDSLIILSGYAKLYFFKELFENMVIEISDSWVCCITLFREAA